MALSARDLFISQIPSLYCTIILYKNNYTYVTHATEYILPFLFKLSEG